MLKYLVSIVVMLFAVSCDIVFPVDYSEVWMHSVSSDDCTMVVLGDNIDTIMVSELWAMNESPMKISPFNTYRISSFKIGKYESLKVIAYNRDTIVSSFIDVDNRLDIYVRISLESISEYPKDSLDLPEVYRKH